MSAKLDELKEIYIKKIEVLKEEIEDANIIINIEYKGHSILCKNYIETNREEADHIFSFLYSHLITIMAKLYDRDKESVNICSLLNQYDKDRGILEYFSDKDAVINNFENLKENINKEFKKDLEYIKLNRDKMYAHLDKEYVKNPGRIFRKEEKINLRDDSTETLLNEKENLVEDTFPQGYPLSRMTELVVETKEFLELLVKNLKKYPHENFREI